MLSAEAPDAKPPLLPALAAMTGLQALVAIALFAPGVLAPAIGLNSGTLGLFAAAVCAVGVFTSLWGGVLAAHLGPFRLASLCAAAVIGAMLIAGYGAPAILPMIASGLVLGCAFGPETPASSAVLGRITSERTRPLVFSLRQTGNQVGMIIGSLSLPHFSGHGAFLVIAGIAVLAIIAFEALRPTYDPIARTAAVRLHLREAIALLAKDPRLARLAIASMAFFAMQLTLNAFLPMFAVEAVGLDLVGAGFLVAIAQAGGFIGRPFWGLVAARWIAPGTVIIGLGFAMSACALATALLGTAWPWPAMVLLAALFGLSASGWNGVFVGEVARLAPDGRVGEATGAVLMAGYVGLVIGPLAVAGITAAAGLAASFAALGAASLVASFVLLRGRP